MSDTDSKRPAGPYRCKCGALQVRHLMTRDPVVAFMETPLPDLLKMLGDHGIRHLPILDDTDTLRGIVSQRDLARAQTRMGVASMTASQIMTRSPSVVRFDDCASAVAIALNSGEGSSRPVVDEKGHLVGMLTEKDYVRYYTHAHRLFESRKVAGD